MILIDTSVWVDHLRAGDARLARLLEQDRVMVHDLVIGEIACGTLKNRKTILDLLNGLPRCRPATHDEVLYFIDRHRLMGRGIGYIDASLLAAAALNGVRLLTRDKRLTKMVRELDLDHTP